MKNGIDAARDGARRERVTVGDERCASVPAGVAGHRQVDRPVVDARPLRRAGSAAVRKILILDAGEAELALVARLRLRCPAPSSRSTCRRASGRRAAGGWSDRPGCSPGRARAASESVTGFGGAIDVDVASTLTTYACRPAGSRTSCRAQARLRRDTRRSASRRRAERSASALGLNTAVASVVESAASSVASVNGRAVRPARPAGRARAAGRCRDTPSASSS